MKKYSSPVTTIINVETKSLIAASDPLLGGTYTGGTILSRRHRKFVEEDEEEEEDW